MYLINAGKFLILSSTDAYLLTIKYDIANTIGVYLKLNIRTDIIIIRWFWHQSSKQSFNALIRPEAGYRHVFVFDKTASILTSTSPAKPLPYIHVACFHRPYYKRFLLRECTLCISGSPQTFLQIAAHTFDL